MAKFDLATSMNGIMSDPAYQSVFLKTAAKKEDSKEEKAKKKEKEDKEKEKLKAKEDKEKAKAKEEKEKEKAKAKEEKAKKKKSSYEVCVMGLAKISELLDDAGLEKAASYALLSLDSLVKSAQEITDDDTASVDMQPAKDEVELVDADPEVPEISTDEYLADLLSDTEVENPEYKGDGEFNFETLAAKDDVSALLSLASDLRVILAKGKKKEEEKDAKGKKDKEEKKTDKKNPFAKKDDKKDDKKDKKDEKKTKKAGFDFL